MNGQLREHPLAELLRQMSTEQVSGAVRLARERVKAVIYCDKGAIVFTSSNLRPQRLIQCLARWQSIPERNLQQATANNFSTDAELARWLISTNSITPGELRDLQIRQAMEILRSVLLWTNGEWSFDPRARTTEETRLTFDAPMLFLEAARRLPVEFAETRLANGTEIISPASEAASAVELLPNEAFVLSRLYAPLRLDELVAVSGLGEREARHVIYTLALGALVTRESWPPILDEQTLRQAKVMTERESKQPATVASVAVKELPANGAGAPVASGKETAATSNANNSSVPQPEAAPDLNILYARARAATYYEVLGVANSAPFAQIKAAYYALAKSYHPDRFHRDVGAGERARIETAFAKIAQAYETLKNGSTRASYDLKLKTKR
ncbi:MAG: DnaJ domain-containing protein [Pyrinomonadaceae bacterium]|nr:DnaJ domain-containing protein [Pyrinomonadaceae bacterium]